MKNFFQYLAPSYYTLVGIWLFVISLIWIYFVFFTLSTFQLQAEINQISKQPAEASTGLVMHMCDVGPLTRLSSIKDLTIVGLECIPHQPKQPEFYTVSDFQQDKGESTRPIMSEIHKVKERLALLKDKRDNSSYSPDSLDYRITLGQIDRASQELLKLNNKRLKEENDAKRIRAQIHDVQHYRKIFYLISSAVGIDDIWTLPKSMLATLLTLAMGGLGSLVFVTIQYLSCDQETFGKRNVSEYIFRPLLGSLMALVMYIVVRSGQASFFDESLANLSPFVLSFISIISGMASETMYNTLSKNIKVQLGTTEG